MECRRDVVRLGNPAIDQQAMLAWQDVDTVLPDVERRVVDLAQDDRQRRAGVEAQVTGDVRDLVGLRLRAVVELHGRRNRCTL